MKSALSTLALLLCTLTACGGSPAPAGEMPGTPPGKACTEEAKVCPDGSAVSRTGPNCEFAPCPGEGSTAPAPP